MENQYAGQGGSYAVDEDGDRRLVERTEEPPSTPEPAPPADTEEPDQPASAGFFTPVIPAAPADQPTTNPENP